MASNGLLIVGASHAGVQLATSLRELGYDEPITMVEASQYLPYQRPPLSKGFLLGSTGTDSLLFRNDQYWSEHDIKIVRNEAVCRIDMCGDGAGLAHGSSGNAFPFDRLALAVGARTRLLPVPGAEEANVAYLRSLEDAVQLRSRLERATRVVIAGGGFVGLEVAASIAKLGKLVTVVEAESRLLGRAVGPEAADHVLRLHRENGIEILLGSTISCILGADGGATGVVASGETIETDLVVAGIGVVPNTDLAMAIGLRCEDGIWVDEHGVTSDGVTIAVGDCTNQPVPSQDGRQESRIRLESVNNTTEQAKAAAQAMLNGVAEERSLPWFWSHQGDITIQIAGLTHGHDRVLTRLDAPKGRVSVLYYRDSRVIAAECVNSAAEFVALKSAISRRSDIPFDRAADASVPLRTIISEAAQTAD